MGRLIYSALTSLDGYIEDADGTFDWAEPDAEVHAFINSLERTARTHLLGRRMYEMMTVWDTIDDPQPQMREFAEIWRAADKVVYSRTLQEPSTKRTRIEREFEPDAVRALKAKEGDLAIGGPGLAQHAFAADLIDECHLFLAPVIVGGGKPGLPDGVRIDLELQDARRFSSGFVFLRYRTRA